jgi:hypothetical protein
MTVHETEWRRMTLEERVDKLRLQLLAQEAAISVLIQGLRAIGIDFVVGTGSDDAAGPAEPKTSARRSQRRPPRRRRQPEPNA